MFWVSSHENFSPWNVEKALGDATRQTSVCGKDTFLIGFPLGGDRPVSHLLLTLIKLLMDFLKKSHPPPPPPHTHTQPHNFHSNTFFSIFPPPTPGWVTVGKWSEDLIFGNWISVLSGTAASNQDPITRVNTILFKHLRNKAIYSNFLKPIKKYYWLLDAVWCIIKYFTVILKCGSGCIIALARRWWTSIIFFNNLSWSLVT